MIWASIYITGKAGFFFFFNFARSFLAVLFVATQGLLTGEASLVSEHRLGFQGQ